MATHSKFDKANSEFIVVNGKLIDGDSLGANVAAKMNRSTGDLEALNINETYNSLDQIGWHLNDEGRRWWSDPSNQVFGTENTGGSGNWGIYKQTNIYTTARKYAGKDSLYGMHLFRYPNISSSSTWGGLRLNPPSQGKLRGHKYRFSFDYRGYTGGHVMEVYQNTSIGWGDLGLGLPTPWWGSIGSFDTDWEWRRYEYDYEIKDEYLDWIPGSNANYTWDANTQYPDGWYRVAHNGVVYGHRPGWTLPTKGRQPQDEPSGVWFRTAPMTPGYYDLYREIKIGFSYNTQNTRGTHVYVDNIQLTDITTNQRWKFNGTGWEADNLAEKTTHVFAKGTAYMGLDSGNGTDKFAIEGSRYVSINGANLGVPNSRGLVLSVINEATGSVAYQTSYDTYGNDAARNDLANALSNIGEDQLWILTSFDAIRTNAALSAQMASMGSIMHIDDNNEYSVFKDGSYRSTYAAVGRGQKLIKEDGSSQLDTVYKRKAVIDLKV
jgi:hypothetical protein